MQRAGVKTSGVTADVHVELTRNAAKRLRIGKVQVELHPGASADSVATLEHCTKIFEDFCVVTQSVREGIDVEVHVHMEDVRATA
jgi:organic hydroperoxide reductase OsmC/OhrA